MERILNQNDAFDIFSNNKLLIVGPFLFTWVLAGLDPQHKLF